MKFYAITAADAQGAERKLRAPSPTDVQAADAAAPLMKTGESVHLIRETPDDGLQRADGPPPRTQAGKLAPTTPGMAARRDPS